MPTFEFTIKVRVTSPTLDRAIDQLIDDLKDTTFWYDFDSAEVTEL